MFVQPARSAGCFASPSQSPSSWTTSTSSTRRPRLRRRSSPRRRKPRGRMPKEVLLYRDSLSRLFTPRFSSNSSNQFLFKVLKNFEIFKSIYPGAGKTGVGVLRGCLIDLCYKLCGLTSDSVYCTVHITHIYIKSQKSFFCFQCAVHTVYYSRSSI